MKLQLALDFCKDFKTAMSILEEVGSYIDIIEMGTPLLMENGLSIISQVKNEYANKTILADLKIMDAGRYETEAAFIAGADIVTVMAVAEDKTIEAAVKCAGDYGRKIMVDLLAVHEMENRIREMDCMGVDYLCLHTSKDLQRDGMNAAASFLQYKKQIKRVGVAIAGGICAENAADYAALNPEIMIVGEGIVSRPDREKQAQFIKSAMRKEQPAV